MEIKVGQFGRFWDDVDDGYSYGYLRDTMERRLRYVDHLDIAWQHFEPADPQPGWPTRRRVIKDRAKLCRVLLDMGYVPDDNGNFVNSDGLVEFLVDMFRDCGEDVEWDDDCSAYRAKGGFLYYTEWTEEY